jgi:hypothetical protein
MFDNHHEYHGRAPVETSGAVDTAAERSAADREVPVGLRSMPASLHDWLDGEGTTSEAIAGGATARHVAFWNRIDAEARERREARAPLDLEARIMAALPDEEPEASVAWPARSLTLTPMVAIAAAAGLLALGAALGAVARDNR